MYRVPNSKLAIVRNKPLASAAVLAAVMALSATISSANAIGFGGEPSHIAGGLSHSAGWKSVLARADEVEIGTGAVCDTEKQAERLASLVTDGAEVALQTVNAEEHDATACEVLTVAFVRGTRVGLVRTKDVTMEIVEILVLGVVTPSGLQRAEPAVYFSPFNVEEMRA